ncbi:hypoxanthine phosphoribosyltransferase [Spiroplasma endosymbiont of Amphibalanus improvisus]|uniref:hypoxanthine phosphoribosyltransferase n=1 Tax=Spiroplasma endosymbiont of Amphibalanus improvisus TaxID=3066327 RepID=UPI00313DAB8E
MNKHPLVKEILFDHEQIRVETKKVAEEIAKFYQTSHQVDNAIICLGLLKGSIPFMAEFLNNFNIDCETEYMITSSFYGGVKAKGVPEIKLDMLTPATNRDILIIEDIIDSGNTLKLIRDYLLLKGAKTVKIVTLLDKKSGRKVDIDSDWTVFEIPDSFVVGFGLDYQEKLRNLPYIGIVDDNKLASWKWKY